MMFKLFDVVRLKKDDIAHGVKRYFHGTIVDVHKNGEAFTVEFIDENGETIMDALLTEYAPDDLVLAKRGKTYKEIEPYIEQDVILTTTDSKYFRGYITNTVSKFETNSGEEEIEIYIGEAYVGIPLSEIKEIQIVDEIEITVLDRFEFKNLCCFRVDQSLIEGVIKPGTLWERQDGEVFVVAELGVFTNCWYNPYEQIGVVLNSASGQYPNEGDVLRFSRWKYGINPSRKMVEEMLDFVEEAFKAEGAIPTELNLDMRQRFGYRRIFERNGEFYRATFIPFDEKPYIVIEWTDNKEYADNGCMEDVEPFPYDLDKGKIVKEVRYAMEIEPYPDDYPGY